jgi:hypothetical protein
VNYKPLIIIGAGRSGTNILRDLLTALPGVGTWPCDEINYIWRSGHKKYPSDEFPREFATAKISRRVRRAFDRIAAAQRAEWVVEKTCANSLRIGFVDAIVPEALFVNIVRDGRDVVGSATVRWTAGLDLRYLLAKARWIPPLDLPYYACNYAANRLSAARRADRRLAAWGPRFDGLQEILRRDGLEAACAAQWARCVDAADAQLASIDPKRVITLKYEDLATDPRVQLRRITQRMGRATDESMLGSIAGKVSRSSVGRWRMQLNGAALARAMPHMQKSLERHGYAP